MAVPPVLADLVSAPNAPTRSGRGGRDRRSKFYELSDNLGHGGTSSYLKGSQSPTGASKRAFVARDPDRKVPRATTPASRRDAPERGSYRTPTASRITEASAPPLGGMRLAR
jgi:hypothetical protein